jgi:GNAT superfamily N-acetyltransferase
MTIRPAVPDDAVSITALLAELGYPDNTAESVHKRLELWNAEPRSTVFVAEQDGVVVGVVAVSTVPFLEYDGRFGRVVALVTAESVRGQGVGRALMAAAEEAAREFGCVLMEVTSANRREPAHAFYQSLGYSNYSDRSGRFVKDLEPGFSNRSYAARHPAKS